MHRYSLLSSTDMAVIESLILNWPYFITFPHPGDTSQFSSMFPVIVPPLAPRYDANRALQVSSFLISAYAPNLNFPPLLFENRNNL